jgi:hypothetical protein
MMETTAARMLEKAEGISRLPEKDSGRLISRYNETEKIE